MAYRVITLGRLAELVASQTSIDSELFKCDEGIGVRESDSKVTRCCVSDDILTKSQGSDNLEDFFVKFREAVRGIHIDGCLVSEDVLKPYTYLLD